MRRSIGRLLIAASVLFVGGGYCPTLSAQTVNHSTTVKWDAVPVAVSYNVYRRTVTTGYSTRYSAVTGVLTYKDTVVVNGATYFYVVTAVDAGNVESLYSNEVTAVIPPDVVVPPPPPLPPPPPPVPVPAPIQSGNRIKVIATANIRATAVNNGFGTLLGTEPTDALGTVIAVSSATIPGVTAVWVQVKFDSCTASIPQCTGWMGSNNMTVVATPPPPPPPPLLTESCVPGVTVNTTVCTYSHTNFPPGSTLQSTGVIGMVTVAKSVTIP